MTRLLRTCFLGNYAVALWLTLANQAWAEDGGGDYVFPYFLVAVAIGSGVAVVCSPSRRRDKAKPDEYAQKKLV